MKEGLNRKRLSDVLDVQNGYAFPSDNFNSSRGLPLIRIRSLKHGIETETHYEGPYEDKYVVNKGDLLIGMDGEFGCYEWKGGPSLLNQRVCRLQGFSGELLPKFLFYGLNDYLKAIENVTGFTTVKHLSSKQILAIEFPIPPLPEQQRIVALLDEACASFATAKVSAERNLQNAQELFESHLEGVFHEQGEGWVETRLEEVCGFQNGFAFKSEKFTPVGCPILRISNIQNGQIDAGNRIVFFNPHDYLENLERYRVTKGDLLIAMSGATTGKLGFITEDLIYYLNQRVGKFEPGQHLNLRYLYYFLSTKVDENLQISAGSAQPNLSTEQIKGLLLPLPSIELQARIVESLEYLEKEIQRLTKIYERKLATLEELKKSILHRAFSGEL